MSAEVLHYIIEQEEFIGLAGLLATAAIWEEMTPEVEAAKQVLRQEIGRPIQVFPPIVRLEDQKLRTLAQPVTLEQPRMTFYIVNTEARLSESGGDEITVKPGELILTADNLENLEAVKQYLQHNPLS